MNNKKSSINEALKIVEEAKGHEKNGYYYEAAEKFQQAREFFKGINEIKLSAKCIAAQAVNMINCYLETRDIEAFSPNMIDFYIKEIDGIRDLELSKFDKYDILITAYQELEGTFDKAYMKEQANNMYYEKTKLYSKYYWQIAKSNEKGKVWYRTKAFFSRFFHWYCGYGERPPRALFISILFIFIYSWIYSYFNLIHYASPSMEKSIGWLQSFYFSVVTFTTLGFGDIVPKHGIGQALVAIEVMMGYLLLGTLVAILIRKITR